MFDQKDYIFKIVVKPIIFFGEVMRLTFDQSHIERITQISKDRPMKES